MIQVHISLFSHVSFRTDHGDWKQLGDPPESPASARIFPNQTILVSPLIQDVLDSEGTTEHRRTVTLTSASSIITLHVLDDGHIDLEVMDTDMVPAK